MIGLNSILVEGCGQASEERTRSREVFKTVLIFSLFFIFCYKSNFKSPPSPPLQPTLDLKCVNFAFKLCTCLVHSMESSPG